MYPALETLRPDAASDTPLYLQLVQRLKQAISTGQWRAGDALPSERTLMEQLNISRGTARRALEILEEEGVITRTRGSGTFITPRFTQAPPQLEGFSEMMRLQGMTAHSELLRFVHRPARQEEKALFGATRCEVVEMLRLRKAGAIPIALQQAILPASLMPQGEWNDDSLYERLAQNGHAVTRARQQFRAAVADDEQAKLLNIAAGAPLLWVLRTGFDERGEGVELTQTWCVDDYYEVVVELRRP